MQTGLFLVAGLFLLGSICGIAAAGQSTSRSPVVASSVPKGDRVLGMSAGTAETQTYDQAIQLVKAAGVRSVTLSLNWPDIETAPGRYKNDYLAIANSYYPAQKIRVDLILRPINTNRKEVPTDLVNRPFDDPLVIERFNKMLDYLFSRIPNLQLGSVAIGNEIDVELGSDTHAWKQFETFFKAAKAHVKTLRPDVKVGFVATLAGLTGDTRALARTLNADSDIVMVTYYPLNGDFTARDPSVVEADFNRMAGLYKGRQIIMTEVGYPSSADCGSSEAKQAVFVRSVFRAWDAHAEQIRSLTFSWLTDLSPISVDLFADYYGASAKAFKEFLRTLGLRTFPGSGQDKEAFKVLQAEAHLRGW